MEDIRNFSAKLTDIVGLAFDERNFEDLTKDEIKQMVKDEVIKKIETVGVEDWVNSFFDEDSVKEVKC